MGQTVVQQIRLTRRSTLQQFHYAIYFAVGELFRYPMLESWLICKYQQDR